MPTYILLTKLSPDKLGIPNNRENIGREWFDEVKDKCPDVKWVEHYALLGPFDFMDIYEAPDDHTAAKVSMITMKEGAVKAETWNAIPYKQFINIAKEL